MKELLFFSNFRNKHRKTTNKAKKGQEKERMRIFPLIAMIITTTIAWKLKSSLAPSSFSSDSSNSSSNNRKLKQTTCDSNNNEHLKSYFKELEFLFSNQRNEVPCLSNQLKCGWKEDEDSNKNKNRNNLPLFVFAIGIEGSGHHLWNSVLRGVLDCTWVSYQA